MGNVVTCLSAATLVLVPAVTRIVSTLVACLSSDPERRDDARHVPALLLRQPTDPPTPQERDRRTEH